MKRAGLVATRIPGDTVHREGFSPAPIAYKLGRGSRLEVFLYKSERALDRDAAAIDTLKPVPIASASPAAAQPLWIRSANLAALLFTEDAREADRVSLAITAGPPQGFR